MMMQQTKDKSFFSLEYHFFDDSHTTEISMFVDGKNILEFERDGEIRTTRWNLDELVMWLREFLDNMKEDPYPVDCEGDFAAQKDDKARNFDSDDDDVFDEYYDKIDEWNLHHRWHVASSGAVLADVFFQCVGDDVEVSWDNRCVERDVSFSSEIGGACVPKKMFVEAVESFLKAYADHWYGA